jgi:PAS domain S-box-containing protein
MASRENVPSAGTDFEDSLFESIMLSPIASVVTDHRLPDYPIAAVNAAFLELTGYSEDEVVGRNCRFLEGPASDPAARATLRAAIAEKRATLTELINYKKDGTPFRNAVMIAPVFEPGGELAFYIGSQMDVTEEKKLPSILRGQRAAEAVRALTPRQHQVLAHMIQGYRNKQIAARLGIDEKTVKMHRAGLLAKLGVATSADAIRIGVEAGLSLNDSA